MSGVPHWVFEPGLFGSDAVRTAVLVGGAVAAVSALVGVLTVIRGQSFAGHALADVGAAGGSGAFLIGLNPLWGFVGSAVVAAGIMESVGIRRPRGRDLATGIVLGAGLGLAALFLYWDTTWSNTTGASMTVLFGSMFVISGPTVQLVLGFSTFVLAVVVLLYRMLLLSSLHPDLAAARGVPVRLVGGCYLAALAVTVSLSAMTIGAVLSTALLIGPAATALRLTRRPGWAMVLSAAIAVAATWLGILLAYDSYYWAPVRRGWPVSFFVVVLIFAGYLLTHLPDPRPEA
ncbi:metal ABC transporter permease [Streptacidiphilus sp. P02-A3a]|uniref:metal ABC transporter permease n=1 Tax=Streptacidiphilus sp. P02-A3a TaxID=2704468 RepID=UPI0015FA732D|nr:metal ABC transporter permease [Streptacidiphilus sp. P02-A3a]QMU67411.1 metal ABC transporter permease [Streptacidiphilus sp. P02-A3a]